MGRHRYKLVGDWILHEVYLRNGFWRGRIRNKKTGRFQYHNTRETKHRKAEQAVLNWVRELEASKSEESPSPLPGTRFDTAFEEYLGLKQVRPSTLRDYRQTFEAVFTPTFGEQLLDEIEPKDV